MTTPNSMLMQKVLPSPQHEYGSYLWVIIGCSVGGATALIAFVALLIYIRRRAVAAAKKTSSFEPSYFQGPDVCQYAIPQSLSSGSDDTAEPDFLHNGRGRPPLMQSSSMDSPQLVSMTSECVQPRPTLSRWNTVGPPNYQATVLGAVLPDLYRGSDDDETCSPPCTNGRLWFSLLYKPEEETLLVTLVKAKYLPGRGLNNSPRDPFVKLYLLPDEENFHLSKVRKRTLAPKFHETFTFQVTKDELPKKSLKLTVYDVDKRKVRHCLGHVVVPLAKTDVSSNEVVWRDLENTSLRTSVVGDLQLSLSCNPFSNRIKVTVDRLRNIQDLDSSEGDVYVRVQLFHGRKVVKSKRTASKQISDPESEVPFDETFSFGVSGRYFDSCSLNFTVMVAAPSPLAKDQPHSRVIVGPFMYARGEPLLHWQEMLSNPRSLITRWHNLESLQTC